MEWGWEKEKSIWKSGRMWYIGNLISCRWCYQASWFIATMQHLWLETCALLTRVCHSHSRADQGHSPGGLSLGRLSLVSSDCLPSGAGPGTLACSKHSVWEHGWVDINSRPTLSAAWYIAGGYPGRLTSWNECRRNRSSSIPLKGSIIGSCRWTRCFLTNDHSYTGHHLWMFPMPLAYIVSSNPYDNPLRCILLLILFKKQ